MPRTVNIRGGGQLVWYGGELLAAVRRGVQRRLEEAAHRLHNEVKENLGDTPPPSSPGDYPHRDTGNLQRSIHWWPQPRRLRVVVGTTLKYGLYLELGVAGGKLIVPRRAKALRWVDRRTGAVRFARSVVQGRILPRPFLTRTLAEAWPNLRKDLTKPLALRVP